MHFENLQSGAFHLVTYLHEEETLLQNSDMDCEPGEMNSFEVFGYDELENDYELENELENDFSGNGFLTFSLAHHSICLHCDF